MAVAGRAAFAIGRSLVRALLANPVGLVIAGIAFAALLLWNNWKEISAALKTMWSAIKEGFVRLFHGDLLGAWHSFAGVFLLGFQTLINTLIAGINELLPKAMELQKFHFADDYIKEHQSLPQEKTAPNPKGGSPHVVVRGARPIQVNTTINMDGRKVATAVTQHQAREAARPNTGGPGFDPTLSPVQVGGGLFAG